MHIGHTLHHGYLTPLASLQNRMYSQLSLSVVMHRTGHRQIEKKETNHDE